MPYFSSILLLTPQEFPLRAILDGSVLAMGLVIFALGHTIAKGRAETPKWLGVVSAALFVVGIAGIAFSRQHVDVSAYLALCSVVLLAAGFSLLTAGWVCEISTIPRFSIIPAVLLAFACSILSILVDFTNGMLKDVLNVLVPVASAAFLYLARSRRHAVFGDELPQSNADEGMSTSQESSVFRKYRIVAVALLVIIVIACMFIRGMWAHGGVGYNGIDHRKGFSYAATLVMAIACYIAYAKAESIERCTFFVVLCSIGVYLVSVAIILFLQLDPFRSFITAMYSLLLALLFGLLCQQSSEQGRGRCYYYTSLFLALYAVIHLISYTIVPMLVGSTGDQSLWAIAPLAFGGVALVVVGLTVAMYIMLRMLLASDKASAVQQEAFANTEVAPEPGSAQSIERAVGEVATKYGLTQREADIIALMAQGFTIKRIAEELHLSYNTVQSYTKSIYSKMGVHGKQYVIEIIRASEQSVS